MIGSSEGIKRLILPHFSKEQIIRQVTDCYMVGDIHDLELFADLELRLVRYFQGKKVDFNQRLDLSGASQFKVKVWNETRCIPYGQTRSYKWIAERIGKPHAVRAVGQALGMNPIPIIIPCHRVIRSDGHLGGFSAGLNMKKKLLLLENLQIRA